MGGRTQTSSKNEPPMMATRDVRAPRVYSVSCAFLQGDHLTNPSSATLLTIFLRHVLTNPSDTQDSLPRCFRLGARRSFSPPSLLQEHRPWSHKTMNLPSWSAWVFSLSAFLRRSGQRSYVAWMVRRPGARRSSPCRFSMTIGHGHAVVCLLELGNGY